ncbi:MAG: helix-hairpin-helix domain-containing protein [Bacteroidota bacterium]|nr:helix-hairpin-helix domain-containing protein [Bacteroidota bacterium]
MGFYKDSFRNWFGYTRRERRASFILLVIIMAVLGVRYLFPYTVDPIREIPIGLLAIDSGMDHKKSISRAQRDTIIIRNNKKQKTILEINSADSAELVKLPGIGPVLSSRIVKYRKLIGGFISTDQLREVYGLKEETFKLISGRIRADSSLIRKIKINRAGYGELIRHPYFKKDEVNGILKYRELQGLIKSINDLTKNNILSAETAKKIKEYLEF